jgi:ABC-2 type transport system permease protein
MNGMRQALAGTVALTRLALRRDRITLPAWLAGLAAFTAIITAMSASGFPTRHDLVQATALMASNPAMRMLGLASGASTGGYMLIRGYLTLAVLAAMMSIFTVVRHTRQAEETGRAELVGAAAVGRHAGLAAATIVAVSANVALAVLLSLAIVTMGQPAAGSLAAGASVGAVGIAFAGIAAITTQLASTTRAASGLAAAVLGLSFLASGVGNMAGTVDASGLSVTSAWPAWLSPIGWGEQMRPFGGNLWWPLWPFALLFLLSVAAASVLVARRDTGEGLLPQRPGHPHASPRLRGPAGLAWRLQRGTFVGWAVGMLGFGLVLGSIVGQAKDATGAAAQWYARVGGTHVLVAAFRTSMIAMSAMAVSIYVVQVLLRMRAQEAEGQVEPVLATGVSRLRWVVSYAANAFAGAVALALAFAVGMGLTAGAVLGDIPGELRTLTGASLVQLSGIVVIGAIVIAATALIPRWAGAVSWAILTTAVLAGPLFGTTLKLPQWGQDLSPFTHVPRVPADALSAAPMLALGAIALGVLAVGWAAFRRRDLALPA